MGGTTMVVEVVAPRGKVFDDLRRGTVFIERSDRNRTLFLKVEGAPAEGAERAHNCVNLETGGLMFVAGSMKVRGLDEAVENLERLRLELKVKLAELSILKERVAGKTVDDTLDELFLGHFDESPMDAIREVIDKGREIHDVVNTTAMRKLLKRDWPELFNSPRPETEGDSLELLELE